MDNHMDNHVLLCSTWNSSQCYAALRDGRGAQGRMDTCICMTESPLLPPATITILFIGYTPIQNKLLKESF